jgi:hypothetical protein
VDINETFSTAKTSRSVPVMSFTGRTTGVSMQIPYYVVPGNRLATGDVHHLFAGLSSGSISREALIDVAGVSDTSVTFGSVLSAVTIAASRRTGFATLIPPYQASSRFGQVTP